MHPAAWARASCAAEYKSPASVPSKTITIDGGIIWPNVPEAAMTPVDSSGEYPLRSMVGSDSSPIVTTVAPTMPVDAAKNAPTTTTDTARPPGSGPKTRAIVVSRSLAILERSSVIPIRTNISTASSVSIDCPASTRSFIRFTINEIFRFNAVSQPLAKTASATRGRSGYLKTETDSGFIPL